MKEYCLVLRKTVEKFLPTNAETTTSVNSHNTELKDGEPQHEIKENRNLKPKKRIHVEEKIFRGGMRKKKLKVKHQKHDISPIFDPLPLPKKKEFSNPEVDYLIDIKIKPSFRKYSRSLLILFNKPHIRWNVLGDLSSPMAGYNIITVIKRLAQESGYLSMEEFPFYKMLIDSANIPYDYIKNYRIREQLTLNGVKTRHGWQSY